MIEALIEYRAALEGGLAATTRRSAPRGRRVDVNLHLRTETYEWLRLIAFQAHVPMNVVCICALARFRERHGDDAAPA